MSPMVVAADVYRKTRLREVCDGRTFVVLGVRVLKILIHGQEKS